MIRLFSFALLFLTFQVTWGSDPYPRNYNIDIQHYRFSIEVNDSTNIIEGSSEITILFRNSLDQFDLDLVAKSNDGAGMTVRSISREGKAIDFSQAGERLSIKPGKVNQGDKVTFLINYYGQPRDGLIISKNMFGDRTIFGDNWPNRAHHWLPCIDHPYDKATCEFIVTAPGYYQTIANGILVEKKELPKGRTLAHWKEDKALPTKVMVIGVARFATSSAGMVDGVPIETWVYPQNREAGFVDYKVATQITDYFTDKLGAFPFEKLANVQSTTRYGGMENASNIFYFENSVTGKNERENLIAHEVAHQWFGDSASELDWYHVWLSEGFATYFTSLYLEHMYGKERLAQHMKQSRDEVITYFKNNPSAVIDTTFSDINRVLNTNSYEKGGWFLHMLRKKVGDETFWKGINNYYQLYQYGNAMTDDFRKVMEEVSKENLKEFFDQWLRRPGHPVLSANWTYNTRKKLLNISVVQTQEDVFNTALEIQIETSDGAKETITVPLDQRAVSMAKPLAKRPKKLTLDPHIWLLFEGEIEAK
ncbi:MAG: M1 family metallopeptidase [Cyclobacteriaceae bacterium]|nr:M1 family metallopeptidase [Cyclobacteriaceae bacterium]